LILGNIRVPRIGFVTENEDPFTNDWLNVRNLSTCPELIAWLHLFWKDQIVAQFAHQVALAVQKILHLGYIINLQAVIAYQRPMLLMPVRVRAAEQAFCS
ncbi:Protein of unknown function, partial [Gryllus bimaculatus]